VQAFVPVVQPAVAHEAAHEAALEADWAFFLPRKQSNSPAWVWAVSPIATRPARLKQRIHLILERLLP
jgi:hypothetical protein